METREYPLEPPFDQDPMQPPKGAEAVVQLSIAISLKRIADALSARDPKTGANINDMMWTLTDSIQGLINRGTL